MDKSTFFLSRYFNLFRSRDYERNFEKRIFIVSLKDKKSIRILLKSAGISKIPLIIDCDQINSKPEGLDYISEKFNFKKNEILFIDDNPLHLNDCINSGYKECFMPAWNQTCFEFNKINPENKLADIKFLKHRMGFI